MQAPGNMTRANASLLSRFDRSVASNKSKLYKSGHGTSSFIQNIYRAKYKKSNQSVLPNKRSDTVRFRNTELGNPNKSSNAIARSKTSISPNLNLLPLGSLRKPAEHLGLTDQTRVATTTWKNLRKLAMMNNYD